jgi:membrane protein involved in colicin uptake
MNQNQKQAKKIERETVSKTNRNLGEWGRWDEYSAESVYRKRVLDPERQAERERRRRIEEIEEQRALRKQLSEAWT